MLRLDRERLLRAGILLRAGVVAAMNDAAAERRATGESVDPADEIIRVRLLALEHVDHLRERTRRERANAKPAAGHALEPECDPREATEHPEAADRRAEEFRVRGA